MKTTNPDLPKDFFEEFVLPIEEMIHVRGGELEPVPRPTTPPVKI